MREAAVLRYKGKNVYDGEVDAGVVCDLLSTRADTATREVLWVLYLDSLRRLIAVETVAIGTLDGVDIHPREVFRGAILAGAVSIMLAHNHPSSNCEPSVSDAVVTDRLLRAGELLGIEVLDHIIISDEEYLSMNDEGLLEGFADG